MKYIFHVLHSIIADLIENSKKHLLGFNVWWMKIQQWLYMLFFFPPYPFFFLEKYSTDVECHVILVTPAQVIQYKNYVSNKIKFFQIYKVSTTTSIITFTFAFTFSNLKSRGDCDSICKISKYIWFPGIHFLFIFRCYIYYLYIHITFFPDPFHIEIIQIEKNSIFQCRNSSGHFS